MSKKMIRFNTSPANVDKAKRFAVIGHLGPNREVLAMYDTLSECDAHINRMMDDKTWYDYDNVHVYDTVAERLCLYTMGDDDKGYWCYEGTDDPVT